MAQLVLFGFTISYLINLRSTKTWLKSSNGTRAICWLVVLLNTAFTGMVAHDIWHYGTLPLRGFYDIIAGTLVQAVEPMLLGVIAMIVQLTLGWRSSRVSAYEYLARIRCNVAVIHHGAMRRLAEAGQADLDFGACLVDHSTTTGATVLLPLCGSDCDCIFSRVHRCDDVSRLVSSASSEKSSSQNADPLFLLPLPLPFFGRSLSASVWFHRGRVRRLLYPPLSFYLAPRHFPSFLLRPRLERFADCSFWRSRQYDDFAGLSFTSYLVLWMWYVLPYEPCTCF